MFPSSGYFKGLNCPYFQSGLCERPYCHFRHVKNGKDANVSNSNAISSVCNNGRRASVSADNAVVSTPVGPTGSKVFLSEKRNTYNLEQNLEISAKTSDIPDLPLCVSSTSEPTYDPTPKSLVGAVKSAHLHEEYDPLGLSNYNVDSMPTYLPGSLSDKVEITSNTHESTSKKTVYVPESIPEYVPSSVPEYNPTPINKLKKVKTLHGTDLEYDPVSNFAYSSNTSAINDITEVQYIPLKRARFDDFPSADVDAMSVDGFGDSDSAKFSDSDAVSENSVAIDSGPATENDNEKNNVDLYVVKTCYKDTLVGDEVQTNSAERSKDSVESDTAVSEKISSTSEPNNVSKSTKKDKVEKVTKSKTKNNIERTSSASGTDSAVKNHTSATKTITDKKGKHKSSSNIEGKDLKKEKEKLLVKKEISSEKSQQKSASTMSSSNSASKSSSSKSASKHSSSSSVKSSSSSASKSSSAAKSSSVKSSSKSVPSKSSPHQTSKHTSTSSKSSNKDTSAKSNAKQSNSIQPKDKHSVKKHENVCVTPTSQDGKKSLSRHHSKFEKENVKGSTEKANTCDNRTKPSSNTQSKHEGSQGSKQVTKTICDDLFGQDSDYSDLSDLDEDVPSKSREMTEEQLQQFLEDSDFEYDGDTYDECLRIFNEGIANSAQSNNSEKKKFQDQSSHLVPSVQMKKRVAHHGSEKAERRFVEKARTKMSPGEVMHNRTVAMQKKAMEAEMLKKAESEAISNAISANVALFKNGKSRLAHKTKVFDKLSRDKEEGRTSAITVVKGENRKAHTPTLSNVKRPTIPTDFGSKVPTNIRQRYLNLIINECIKLCKTEEEAYDKAQDEEKAVYQRATNKNIYVRVAANAIVRLRKDVQNREGSPTKTFYCGKQSHKATLDGRKAITTSFTINRSGKSLSTKTADFKGAELYKRLQTYVLTEQQLKDNGFPLPNPDAGGCAIFYTESQHKDVSLKQHEKNCSRCGKRFIVFPNGKYNSKEECIYHWGKAWKKKVAGSLETRYTCCGGDLDSEGCSICKLHVSEDNKTKNLSGYMKTIPCSPPLDGDYGVYAMDCEMVYTNIGLELARVTVVDSDQKSVYETFIKPDFPVIDYNTRFSGITEKDMNGVHTTLRDVQAVLLSLFTDRTILMGHSLESDLVAVKLLHRVVVDTSVVFPHRLGPPYKRALRNLMADHLQKIIQNDIGGHDSQEDALACMELMQWKLKEDAKKEARNS
ncbi:RNA exonuclease 1 homolog [Gigantopelta aegis]|uniref:RNA exonuclease 1 homolog n=1 Tax=Gigantopelta aegis TaxID=1735272 RepID=UPI001B88E576|nr:RNA exonuclease 1 homolog [Gigantopelta aegis]